jgi:hypothetical protein
MTTMGEAGVGMLTFTDAEMARQIELETGIGPALLA